MARSRNVYTSSSIPTTGNHFPRRVRLYEVSMSPKTITLTQVFTLSARYFAWF